MIALSTGNPHIERDHLIRRMGGRRRQPVSNSLSAKLQNGEEALHELIDTRLFYQRKTLERVEKGYVLLKGGPAFKSPKLARTLSDSREVICFITTLGGGIDAQIERLMKQNRLSDAYVLDTLGSLAVENIAERFQARMDRECREEGKTVTLRFSPGYCDWPIAEQRKLFKLFDSDLCGVELLDSCLMRPRKSISGVFGLHPLLDDAPKSRYSPCQECYKRDCAVRRNTR
jgi:hypothetical protein